MVKEMKGEPNSQSKQETEIEAYCLPITLPFSHSSNGEFGE